MASGHWLAAATLYAEAAGTAPQSATAQARWSRALVYANRPAEAVEHAQRAAELDPRSAEAQVAMALASDWNGNPDRAITAARRAAETRLS